MAGRNGFRIRRPTVASFCAPTIKIGYVDAQPGDARPPVGTSSTGHALRVTSPALLGGCTNEEAVMNGGYLTSESSLNIGRYMEMMITPTIIPTPIIISGSMIAVSEAIALSTSSS
jgi:hypothetical protein